MLLIFHLPKMKGECEPLVALNCGVVHDEHGVSDELELKLHRIRVTGPSPDDDDWLAGETLDGSKSGGFPKVTDFLLRHARSSVADVFRTLSHRSKTKTKSLQRALLLLLRRRRQRRLNQ